MTAMPHTNSKSARGRKPDPSSKSGRARELLATGMTPTDVAAKIGCTTALVYNIRARMDGAKKKRTLPIRESKRAVTASPAVELDGILAAVKGAEQERVKMRAALERIQQVLAEALA